MDKFDTLHAAALPIVRPNCDTDQIIPARFLSRPRDSGLAGCLFHDLRFAPDGTEKADFVLNRPPYRTARIVVAERNFACGSSRENAVWALYDYGFRAAIAPSFGDIFANNALKNGVLPVRLPYQTVVDLLTQIEAAPGAQIGIDLPAQIVTAPDGSQHGFEIDPFAKTCLIEGLDELSYTLSLTDEIAAFEQRLGRHND
ncbi:MAG: 3-isopropylmalate dehydratase small subunit [Rhodospirillales bacterium]|nr:3-isopropylmalate dehydratase small subunit [Rhodospirillales bacterium]